MNPRFRQGCFIFIFFIDDLLDLIEYLYRSSSIQF